MSISHPVEKHRSSFGLLIGGLFINVDNAIQCTTRQEEATEYRDFLRSANPSKADIQISMESSSAVFEPVPGEPIFFSPYFSIKPTLYGYQVLRFHNEKVQLPYLAVQTDPQFYRFSYRFYPQRSDRGKTIPVDPVRSAGDFLLLQHSFINHQGLIIHAGGGSIQGKGIVFAGVSGVGKSTFTNLLLYSFDNRLFSDERLIVRLVDATWTMWGTPWQGSGDIARNQSAQLSALVFLSQAQQTKITQLAPSAGLHRLLQVVSIPWYSEEWTNRGLAICEQLVKDVPMYELAFTPDHSAVAVAENLAVSL